MWATVGLIYSIPVPHFMSVYGLTFGHVFVLCVLLFYLILGTLPFQIMVLESIVIFASLTIIKKVGLSTFLVSLIVFVISWILQIIGHNIEGKKPSFLKDIQFLLIGPLWVTYKVLRIDPSKTSTRVNKVNNSK
jgi:uncharacterized membrane protein YGL010W